MRLPVINTVSFIKHILCMYKKPFDLVNEATKNVPEIIRKKKGVYLTEEALLSAIMKRPIDKVYTKRHMSHMKKMAISAAGSDKSGVLAYLVQKQATYTCVCVNLLLTKKVYTYTDELADMVLKTKMPDNWDTYDFERLPAAAVAIKSQVKLEDNLTLEYITMGLSYSHSARGIPLKEEVLRKSIDGMPLRLLLCLVFTCNGNSRTVSVAFDKEMLTTLFETGYFNEDEQACVKAALKLFYYLTTDKIDIDELSFKEAHKTQKQLAGKKLIKKISLDSRDVYEFKEKRVGQVITNAVKEYNSCAVSRSGTTEHAKKRPHMRCGHYHTFWTGSKQGERVAKRVWLPPVFINAKLK